MILVLLAALLLALLIAAFGARGAVLLAALAAAIMLASLSPGPPPSSVAREIEAHLCWLKATATLRIEENSDGYKVAIDLLLQRPNPCYRVEAVTVQPQGAAILVEIRGASPPPGTFCIQVVPPPIHIHEDVAMREKPEAIILSLRDETSGAACSTRIQLRGGRG